MGLPNFNRDDEPKYVAERKLQVWIATYGSAMVALRDWIPHDARPSQIETRRVEEAKRLAYLAVENA
jgi:hypothetical protein